MTAIRPLKNIGKYNCSYVPIDHPKAFDDTLRVYGTGVGFSVEKKYTELLPSVVDDFHDTESVVVVRTLSLVGQAFRSPYIVCRADPQVDISRVTGRVMTFSVEELGPALLKGLST